jgi:hypothetical protein
MLRERILMLRQDSFMLRSRSLMLSRLKKNESTASGNGNIVSPVFGYPFYFLR